MNGESKAGIDKSGWVSELCNLMIIWSLDYKKAQSIAGMTPHYPGDQAWWLTTKPGQQLDKAQPK